MTLEQCLELLADVNGPYAERDYCILTLFLNCGMRLSELVGLNLTDVQKGSDSLRIVGKGNKERRAPERMRAKTRLTGICVCGQLNHLTDRNALFISRQKKTNQP